MKEVSLTVCVIQCRKTGRFLFEKYRGKWRFAVTRKSSFNKCLFEVSSLLGEDYEVNCLFTGSSKWQLLHVVVNTEDVTGKTIFPVHKNDGLDLQWHALYDFPKKLEGSVVRVLKNKILQKQILEP